jgi:hypothetical protein
MYRLWESGIHLPVAFLAADRFQPENAPYILKAVTHKDKSAGGLYEKDNGRHLDSRFIARGPDHFSRRHSAGLNRDLPFQAQGV